MTEDYVDSYYSRTLAEDRPRPALDGPAETEVCVIGGGMAGLATALGEAREFWPREKVRELYRTKRYHDALFNARGFQFHALNFALGIARAAEANGATLHEASPVTGFDLAAEPKVVHTPRGRLRADHVVFCLSGYIDGLHPKLARATLPVATYVMLTEPIPKDRLESAIGAPYAVSDTRFAGDYYRPLPDGRILWGGRVSSPVAPRRLLRGMLGDLVKVYPQLEGIAGEVAWPGTMGYARHKMPQIGGNGMCATTVGGEAVAAAIAGEDQRIGLFEPFGLDFAGGPLGPLVAEALYTWWRLRDRLRAGI